MKLKKRLKFKHYKVKNTKDITKNTHSEPTGRLNNIEAERHKEKISRGNFYGKKWYPN